jgi:hypothetical protein
MRLRSDAGSSSEPVRHFKCRRFRRGLDSRVAEKAWSLESIKKWLLVVRLQGDGVPPEPPAVLYGWLMTPTRRGVVMSSHRDLITTFAGSAVRCFCDLVRHVAQDDRWLTAAFVVDDSP